MNGDGSFDVFDVAFSLGRFDGSAARGAVAAFDSDGDGDGSFDVFDVAALLSGL